jgi:hypothetical protein
MKLLHKVDNQIGSEVVNANSNNVNSSVQTQEPKKKTFTCEKCNKVYCKLSNIRNHQDACDGVGVLECAWCHKKFASRQGKSQHKKICPQKPDENGHHCNTITNFTEENTDYIAEDFARTCLASGVQGITFMIDKLYFDEEHPENHNVKLKSLKHSLVTIQTDKGWVPRPLYSIIDDMASNSTKTILSKMNLEDDVRVQTIQNISRADQRRIREDVKSKLVERRERKS